MKSALPFKITKDASSAYEDLLTGAPESVKIPPVGCESTNNDILFID